MLHFVIHYHMMYLSKLRKPTVFLKCMCHILVKFLCLDHSPISSLCPVCKKMILIHDSFFCLLIPTYGHVICLEPFFEYTACAELRK